MTSDGKFYSFDQRKSRTNSTSGKTVLSALPIQSKVYFKTLYSHSSISSLMPKLKTRKAALKRYKVTGTGNFLRRHAFKGHLLMKKSNKQKRKLSQRFCVNIHDLKPIKLMLPY